jgi:transposase
MVEAVRAGQSQRQVAIAFRVSVSTVAHWVEQARGERIDRVRFANRKPGRAWNRTPARVEQRILRTRRQLRERSVLGEYGADAIGTALQERATAPSQKAAGQAPARSTIYRVLERHGALDAAHRQRRPAPPKGWYLPALAAAETDLDSFDFIEDLKIARGPLVSVLTGISLHAGLSAAWVMPRPSAKATVDALLAHWREHGLPGYAQFDNDTIFQGAHHFADTVGRVSRLCLALRVVPVFAPPREPGFQNAIEGFNALWQTKVWQRHEFRNLAGLENVSARYIDAHRDKTAIRRESAPQRRRFPSRFTFNLRAALTGTMIFVRRSNEHGQVHLLGRTFPVAEHWPHRLVRCEVDFTDQHIRFHALRRRDPDDQPLLCKIDYARPSKPFKGSP